MLLNETFVSDCR